MARSRTPAEPVRETFSLSRTLEFLSESELTKQIGYPQSLWMLAAAKELLDNAMDHCEEIGRLPEISITVTGSSLAVSDNGNGIPPDTVEAMLDFERRVSSREAYRCPTRGAQGNAGKCLIAIPYVLSGDIGKATIEAQGVRHEIAVRLDSLAQSPVIQHEQRQQKVQIGTFVEMQFAELARCLEPSQLSQFVLFCRDYAALNPHLRLTLELPEGRQAWTPTSVTIGKWTARNPDPPDWHDLESFERLVGACITSDREHTQDRLLRDFVRLFGGLKRSEALKAVFDETDLTRANLSDLLNCDGLDHTKTVSLLEAMQRHGQSPKPEKLGCIGRPHIKQSFSELGACGDVKYRKTSGTDERGMPFVVEAAFADIEDERIVITGCNFSPSIDQPVVRILDGLLERQMVDEYAQAAILVHVTTVAPIYLDRGKSVLSIDETLERAIKECVVKVTADYCKRRKREERDAAARERWIDRQSRRKPDCSLKDAIVAVLDEAIERASGGGVCEFSDRDLYYAARELIQRHTSEPLSQTWFDKVVDGWEAENGLIDGRLRDPRGFLLEPHTQNKVPLGTKAVDDYEIPAHLYDTIIYVEKKGLLAKFQLGQIGEKYDCAIIAAEGYAVRAAKALLHAAQRGHRMKVLCFHDADPHGYNIARTLSERTGAQRFQIEVIDAGLNLKEAIEMGLAVETFVRKVALQRGLKLSKLETENFTGDARHVIGKNGKPKIQYVNCKRVELNALSADPTAFVKWIEAKLKKHGVAKKLVPPKAVIAEHAEVRREQILRQHIQRRFDEAIDMPSLVESVLKDVSQRVDVPDPIAAVTKWAKKVKPERWTQCVDELISGTVRKLDSDIRKRVARRLQR